MRDERVVGSKRIMTHVRETYEILLPLNASAQDIDQAELELKTYASLIGQNYNADVLVSRNIEDERLVLSVRGPSSANGLDYNQSVYSHIVWVEDNV